MKMKVDLSKFKLKDRDDKMATLIHPDGHEFRVAVSALHPENRKNLDAIPMAKGGEVKKPKAKKLEVEEIQQEKLDYEPEGKMDPRHKGNKLEVEAMANGGEIKSTSSSDSEVDRQFKETANKKLDPERMKKFKNPFEMKNMAEGGEAEEDSIPIQTDPYKVQIPQSLVNPEAEAAMAAPSLAPAPQMQQPAAQSLAPQVQQPAPMAQPAQAAASQTPSLMHGYESDIAGKQAEAQALAQQGDAQAKALEKQVTTLGKMSQQYQAKFDDLDRERKAFQQDVMDSHIDANRYLGSMTTGQKFDTAVGLILGGLGGGGQGNAAQDFLNRQIDRDIEAQKANLNKKESLLSANMRQFGNLKDAMDMTKVMMNDQVIAKLKLAEAKAQNPLAKARAQQEIAKLEMQVAPMVQQLATKQALSQFESQTQQDPSMYPQLIAAYEKVDPEKAKDLRERLVPGVGLANTPKDANEVKEITVSAQGAKRGIQELRDLISKPLKSLNPLDKAKAESVRQQLIGQLRTAILGPGTVNEAERKLMENIIPDVTSLMSLDASNKVKLDALEKRLMEGVGQNLSARGVAGSSPSFDRQAPMEPVERITKDGRVALFDPKTKQFLRFK